MIVYAIIRRVNGKVYVGATTLSVKQRLRAHRRNAANPKHHRKNGHLARAIHTHGWDAFVVVELEHCSSLDSLNDAEREWIKRLSAAWPNGYNVRGGGRDGALSETTKMLLTVRSTGRKLTPSARALAIKTLNEARHKIIPPKGEKNGRAKLTANDVRAIRSAWIAGGVTQQKLADTYGVTQMSITKIVNRINWKHIP